MGFLIVHGQTLSGRGISRRTVLAASIRIPAANQMRLSTCATHCSCDYLAFDQRRSVFFDYLTIPEISVYNYARDLDVFNSSIIFEALAELRK